MAMEKGKKATDELAEGGSPDNEVVELPDLEYSDGADDNQTLMQMNSEERIKKQKWKK